MNPIIVLAVLVIELMDSATRLIHELSGVLQHLGL